MLRILTCLHGRQAKPASKAWNLTKTYFQTLVFWSALLFAVPAFLNAFEKNTSLRTFRFASPLFSFIGAALFFSGSALALWSCYVLSTKGNGTPVPFDCPSKLVVEGPYHHVRNPMAVSGIIQGLGIGLFLGSPIILYYVVVGVLIAEFVIHPWEEADIERRFGGEYRKYRNLVPRWLPKLRGHKA